MPRDSWETGRVPQLPLWMRAELKIALELVDLKQHQHRQSLRNVCGNQGLQLVGGLCMCALKSYLNIGVAVDNDLHIGIEALDVLGRRGLHHLAAVGRPAKQPPEPDDVVVGCCKFCLCVSQGVPGVELEPRAGAAPVPGGSCGGGRAHQQGEHGEGAHGDVRVSEEEASDESSLTPQLVSPSRGQRSQRQFAQEFQRIFSSISSPSITT